MEFLQQHHCECHSCSKRRRISFSAQRIMQITLHSNWDAARRVAEFNLNAKERQRRAPGYPCYRSSSCWRSSFLCSSTCIHDDQSTPKRRVCLSRRLESPPRQLHIQVLTMLTSRSIVPEWILQFPAFLISTRNGVTTRKGPKKQRGREQKQCSCKL